MALSPGTRVGSYDVQSLIGAGGMGEVYRARDTRLDRDVALKILPPAFAADPDRLARFRREAQVLASLNHPHIAAIYGFEDSGSIHALVLEMVDGPTLADRIAQSPIPIDEALPIARQIVEALQAAHEQGVIHRDLKPANIKLRGDGSVKVLDFGLAKMLTGDAAAAASTPALLSLSPTIASPALSAIGAVLGTAAYMAPEQARGRAADKRSDVWGFGCVLFEMLTGRRAFEGDDASDLLAMILKGDPDWNAVPASTPPRIQRLLRQCLERDRARRIPDISVAGFVIDEVMAGDGRPAAAAAPWWQRGRTLVAAAVVVIAAAAISAAAVWYATAPAPRQVVRFDVTPTPAAPLTLGPAGVNLVLSPDGMKLVYHVVQVGTSALELRRLDRGESQLLPQTSGAVHPVFSPDSNRIAFVRDGRLHTMALDGKTTVSVADVPDVMGVSWADDGTLVFAQVGKDGGLYRVPAGGGKPARITAPDPKLGEQDYVDPSVLPGGAGVLFTALTRAGSSTQGRVAARSFHTGDQKMLVDGASSPRYLPSGHLMFVQGGVLMVSAFDPDTLTMTGAPLQVIDRVPTKGGVIGNYSVSGNGTLAYVPGSAVTYVSRFIWKHRDGKTTPAAGGELDYPRYPRLSPDGRRLAATIGPSNEGNVWVYDLDGSAQPLKLTFGFHNVNTAWSPDGRRLAFESTRDGLSRNIFTLPADASAAEPERLVTNERNKGVLAWSPDGRSLLYRETGTATKDDLWLFSTTDGKSRPWLQTPFDEDEAAFSPDGRFVAYVTDQTGQPEVWARPFPGPGSPVRVSPQGGHDPVWARNGRELFYQQDGKLLSAEVVTAAATIQFRSPRLILDGGFVGWQPNTPRSYDVHADGRFLMIEPTSTASVRVNVILNWFEEVAQRIGSN